MEKRIRIALVEDQAVNRHTFLRKVDQMERCELIFVAVSGHDCLKQLKNLPETRKPEVIFMDIEMPGISGIATVAQVHRLYPFTHCLMFTVFDDDDKIFNAIRAGAEGYLLKHESARMLQEAAFNVLEYGGAPMSPAIARKALQLLSRAHIPEKAGVSASLPPGISERETGVLQLMVSGLDAKSMASRMDLSVNTVRKHIANIYNKLYVCSRSQILSLAHQEKWFE